MILLKNDMKTNDIKRLIDYLCQYFSDNDNHVELAKLTALYLNMISEYCFSEYIDFSLYTVRTLALFLYREGIETISEVTGLRIDKINYLIDYLMSNEGEDLIDEIKEQNYVSELTKNILFHLKISNKNYIADFKG